MNAASLARTLVDRGVDAAELEGKRRLFETVLDAFGRLESGAPQYVWWVPGRLEVFGKHTDYAGGRTLVCALPRGFAVAARPRDDRLVRAVDARTSETVIVDPGGEDAFDGWRHYVAVVVRRLARNFPACRLGADIVFVSDLPPASGMSSSSALMVSIATALVTIGKIDASAEWRANIRTVLDAAGYFGCVENGSRFGTLAGDAGVGTHGGSEDHAAILAGRPGRLTGLSFVPMREIRSVAVPAAWRFVLAPSGVAAEKTGGARDPYNQLSRRARVLLEVWNGAEPEAGSLGAALASRPDAADRLRDLVRSAGRAQFPTETLLARLDHFIREDARVNAALDAFEAGDDRQVGRLSFESQRDAEALLGNQVPETIALANSARTAGAFAACSFGAGFGGSVWALVERDRAASFAADWHPDAFVALPGTGVVTVFDAQ